MKLIDYIKYKIGKQNSFPKNPLQNLVVDMKSELDTLEEFENGQELFNHIAHKSDKKTTDALYSLVRGYRQYGKHVGFECEEIKLWSRWKHSYEK